MANFSGQEVLSGLTFSEQSLGNPSPDQDVTSGLSFLYQSTTHDLAGEEPFPIEIPDLLAPEISNLFPVAGATISPLTQIVFDITDNIEIGFVEIQVDQGQREVIHDGDSFLTPYLSSSREAIVGGWRYTIQRTGGWIAPPNFRVRVFDTSCNEGIP